MKLLLVLLFSIFGHYCNAQDLSDFPNLKAVYNSMGDDFNSLKGELVKLRLPDTAYHSKLTIETSLGDQIQKSPTKGYLYQALLSATNKPEEAKQLVEGWGKVLSSLAQGYTLSVEKRPNDKYAYLGYLFTKVEGNEKYTIKVFSYTIEGKDTYPVNLIFNHTRIDKAK